MRLKITGFLLFFLSFSILVNAQVWFPEGVFTQNSPELIKVDNFVMTISKIEKDTSYSYWKVCVNDGKSWLNLPVLKLNSKAEIFDMKIYLGMVHIAGRFEFENGKFNALVRYNGFNWQGVSEFKSSSNISAAILCLNQEDKDLILGGNFYTIGKDTLPNLARYNSGKFSTYFKNCLSCQPNGSITGLASNDSVIAISGQFTEINNQKSKFLVRLFKHQVKDTFLNTPFVVEKLALEGDVIYMSGGAARNKKIFKVTDAFTELRDNLDTTFQIGELVTWDDQLVLSGSLKLNSENESNGVYSYKNGKWTNISNNYSNVRHIASGRSVLVASGTPTQALSIWNPNRYVVRFYPNLALVKAKVFLDSNNNCIQEPNERPVPKQFIRLPFINRGVFTNHDGLAEFLIPNAIQTTWRFAIKPFRNMVRSNCADTSVTKTFYPGVFSDSIQFPLKRVPNVNDIRVFISSARGTQVMKNKKVLYYINYENVGSNPISGSIVLRKSPYFTKEFTIPNFDKKIDASSLQWIYKDLQPGERSTIVYSAYPEDAKFDTNLQFDAQVASSISSGNSPYSDDDFDSIPQEVSQGISAFRKEVYPTPDLGDSITYLDNTDRDLRYNISFNNFSNDTVFYAVVIDTLDLNLDMSYIEETGSNKSYYTEVQTDPDNQYKGILIWHFPNIKLAPNPSMNYESTGSGAYIGFKVVTKPLSKGYVIKNSASVFYDNTFAGNTNAVYCTLAPTDIFQIHDESSKMKVYPNPFSNQFELEYTFNAGNQVVLLDVQGKQVYSERLRSSSESVLIQTNDLPQGMYILQVNTNQGVLSKKILKMY